MYKRQERIQQEDEPEEQHLQNIAREEQEATIAQPQISTITATEEVSQANAQLHAELASQLEEPGFVNENQLRTDDTMEDLTAPQDQEMDTQRSGEDTHMNDHAEIQSVIPETSQVARTLRDTMGQDFMVDRPNDLLNVAHEVASITDVSSGADTSSIEQSKTNEETAENMVPVEEDSEAELPVVVDTQLDSVTDGEPDVDMVSQHAADIDAHDETEKITYLEDNVSPVVVNEDGEIHAHDAVDAAISLEDNALPTVISPDEPSMSEARESEGQLMGEAMLQAQNDISRSVENITEHVMELAATVEAATAIPPLPNTDLDPCLLYTSPSPRD